MAIQLPQDQINGSPTPQLRATPTARFSGAKGAQLDGRFVDTLGTAFINKKKAEEKALLKKKKAQGDFILKKNKNEADELSLIAKSEVAATRGTDTFEMAPERRKKLDKDLAKLRESVPDEYKQGADLNNQSASLGFERTVLPHSAVQAREIREGEYKTHTANAINGAQEFSANPKEFGFALKQVEASARDTATLRFGSGPEAKLQVQEQVDLMRSKTVLLGIKQEATRNTAESAKNLMDTFKDSLTPEDLIKATKIVDVSVEDNVDDLALRLAIDAASEFSSPQDQLDRITIQSGTNGKVFRKATQLSTVINTVKDRETKFRKAKATGAAYDQMDKNLSDGVAMGPEFWKTIPREDRQDMMSYVNKLGNIDSDSDEYNRAMELFATDRPAFQEYIRSIDSKRGVLSRKHISGFRSMNKNIIEGDNNAEARVRNTTDRLVSDIVEQFMAGRKIRNKSQKAEIYRLSRDVVDQLKDVKGITTSEIRTRISKALQDSKIKKEDVAPWYKLKDVQITGKDSVKVDLSTPDRGGVTTDSKDPVHPSVIDNITRSWEKKHKGPIPPKIMDVLIRKYNKTRDVRDVAK